MIEKVYLLHARAQSGKDTCAALMKEEYEKKGKKVIIIAFADYVKFTLGRYYGIQDYKTTVGRTTIQHFATDLVRGKDPTFWARTVVDFLAAVSEDFDIVIVPDWRFYNEYNEMLKKFQFDNVVCVLIQRPDNEHTDHMTAAQRAHASESELDSFNEYDYVITNEHGELGRTAAQLYQMIEEEESRKNELFI